MEISPIVFLGPSLDRQEASTILTAEYREPIQSGDLNTISPPTAVAIIDGILDPQLRLSKSEVEHALRRGLRIYGSASTGALLAAELYNAGMIGTGKVFEFLRTVTGNRDDLVAVFYQECGHRPLTIPIINILLGCRELGWSEEMVRALNRTLQAIPLAERSWQSIEIATRSADLPLPEALRALDAKANDARLLLARLRAEVPNCGT